MVPWKYHATYLVIGLAWSTAWSLNYPNQPDFADFRKSGKVIHPFSSRRDNRHYGVTLRLRESSVRSLADGRVYSATEMRGYGRVVIIDHGHGWHTLYSGVERSLVKPGQHVSRGDVIGMPHGKTLFLVVSYRGNPINPSDVIGRRPRGAEVPSERAHSGTGGQGIAAAAILAG